MTSTQSFNQIVRMCVEFKKVDGGIEYNSYNRAVGFYIKQYDVDEYISLDLVWIEVKNIIFYFSKRCPLQVREMSNMCPHNKNTRC